MALEYNIWGISNNGYSPSISKSETLKETTLSALKDSFSDQNRRIAMDFASVNPRRDYFYSIEKRATNILYTIYRTNWYLGTRLSYDAATIISSSGSIENPITALKSLMNAYVGMKEKKFINSNNLDQIISNVLMNPTNTPLRSVLKSGYVKYNTESDLIKVFKNDPDTIKNFNKVYFFTKLPYLESGVGKIPNVSDYKQMAVSIINFDSSYHRVLVNGVPNNSIRTTQRQTFNCFPTDEIKVFIGDVKIPTNVYTATIGMPSIILKPKPQAKVVTKNNSGFIDRNKKINSSNKKNQEKNIILGICVLLVLVIGSFFAYDSFSEPDREKPRLSDNCVLIFKDNNFYNSKNKIRSNGEKIFECFKVKGVKLDSEHYILSQDFEIKKRVNNEEYNLITDPKILDELKQKIVFNSISSEIMEAIDKVKNYNFLISEKGLQGKDQTWIWQKENKKLVYLRNSDVKKGNLNKLKKIDPSFLKSNKENIIDFFTNKFPLPNSVFSQIKNYLNTIDGSNTTIQGCMDSDFQEYKLKYTEDTKPTSCKNKHVVGCMKKAFKEYDSKVTKNKQSDCKTKKTLKGCMDSDFQEYKSKHTEDTKPTSCKNKHVLGCKDNAYKEFKPKYTKDTKPTNCKTLKGTEIPCINPGKPLKDLKSKVNDLKDSQVLEKFVKSQQELVDVQNKIKNLLSEIEKIKDDIKKCAKTNCKPCNTRKNMPLIRRSYK